MAATKTETYEYSVGDVAHLCIRNTAGSVKLRRGASGQVRVVVTKKVRGGVFSSGSERELDELKVTITQDGDRLTIEAEPQHAWGMKSYTFDFDITTPETTDTELELSAGNVRIEGVTGSLQATLNAGNLDARDVTLVGSSSLTINAGNLDYEGALAPETRLDARLNAGNAEFRLPQDTPATLDAETTVGAIRVSGWQVNTTRNIIQQQASGRLGAAPSGTLRVRVNAGSVGVAVR